MIDDVLYAQTYLFRDMEVGRKYRILSHPDSSIVDFYKDRLVTKDGNGNIVLIDNNDYWSPLCAKDQEWLVVEV